LAVSNASIAAIFDMDGTLIDNTPYHFKSWQELFRRHGKSPLSHETYLTQISGVPVMETMQETFGDEYDEQGLVQLRHEKDDIYKKEYLPFLAPINGLENFLAELKDAGIKMALASSTI
jgi:beta-phosphoglucomutase-like phosphatase (HAD superfamily)